MATSVPKSDFLEEFCLFYDTLLIENFSKRKFAVAAYYGQTGEALIDNLSTCWRSKKNDIEHRWKQMFDLDLSCNEVKVKEFEADEELKTRTELYCNADDALFEAEWPNTVDVLLEYIGDLPLDVEFTKSFVQNWKENRAQILRLWESALTILNGCGVREEETSMSFYEEPELPRATNGDLDLSFDLETDEITKFHFDESACEPYQQRQQSRPHSPDNHYPSIPPPTDDSEWWLHMPKWAITSGSSPTSGGIPTSGLAENEAQGGGEYLHSLHITPPDAAAVHDSSMDSLDDDRYNLNSLQVENADWAHFDCPSGSETDDNVFNNTGVLTVKHVSRRGSMNSTASETNKNANKLSALPGLIRCKSSELLSHFRSLSKSPTNSTRSDSRRSPSNSNRSDSKCRAASPKHSPTRSISHPVQHLTSASRSLHSSRDDLRKQPKSAPSVYKQNPWSPLEGGARNRHKSRLLVQRPTRAKSPLAMASTQRSPTNIRAMATMSPTLATKRKLTMSTMSPSPDQPMPQMEEPVPLLVTDKQGKWKMCERAAEILSAVRLNIAVVSIVGKYRTGKSYLMNRLAGSSSGFNLGSTIQSETKGIWMWLRAHPYHKDECLLLLDTEGLYDVEKGDRQHDLQLFTLALLLSNCMVFNTVGSIDNAFVEELQLVSELSRSIKVKSSPEANDEYGDNFAKYFPNLFVVVRDFFLELKKDGKEITEDEYLENSLKLKKGMSTKAQEYNAPRECIRNYFPNKKCFVLPKPVRDDALLRNLETVRDSDLVPEFIAKSAAAVDAIARQAVPLTIDTLPVTGSGFVHLVTAYAEAINQGGVPCIESAVDAMAERESRRACEEALAAYNQMMEDCMRMPVCLETLREVHEKSQREAVRVYRKKHMFDQAGTFLSQLEDSIAKAFETFEKRNAEISKRKAKETLDQCFKSLDKDLKMGVFGRPGGHAAFIAKRNQAIAEYKSRDGLGPMRDHVLSERLAQDSSLEQTIIRVDKQLGDNEKQEAHLKQELMAQQEQQREAERQNQHLRKQIQAQQRDHAHMLEQLQWDYDEQLAKLISEHDEQIRRKETEHQEMVLAGLERQAQEQERIVERLRAERSEREWEGEQIRQELQDYKREVERLEEERRLQDARHQIELDEWQIKIASVKYTDTEEQKRLTKQKEEAEKRQKKELESLQKECRKAKERVKKRRRGLCSIM